MDGHRARIPCGRRAAIAVLLTCGAPGILAPASADAQASTAAILASPEPGARAASARTQISLRGAPADQLGAIVVTGSRSGRHSGRLLPHSDGAGASFVPSRPFREGERVTVRTQLRVRGATAGRLRFDVAEGPLEGLRAGRGLVSRGQFAQQQFRSRPDLRPPAVTVTTRRPDRTTGEILLSPKQGKRDGPLILDDRGEVVWFRPQPRGRPASDLRVGEYRGQPVLTYWEGRFVIGWGFGEGVVLDSAYREVARVRAGNGYHADLHDFFLTPQGTAMLVVYHRVRRDLRAAGGPRRGWVLDGIVQEVDPATGLVLFEWHALDHVPLRETYAAAPKGRASWDWFHINSVQVTPDGDLVVSARNTHAVYAIDRETGAVKWRLGGRRSDFRMGRGTRFAWQHDARLHDDGTLTVFDNAAAPPVRKHSRALRLRLDVARRRATVITAAVHPRGLLSAHQGGVQALAGGRLFVGWGQHPWFTEFGPGGRVIFDGRLAKGYDSYRAYRADWTGRPAGAPAVAAQRREGDRVAVWASWNGATEVDRWEVLIGDAPDAVTPAGTRERTGFETAISVPGRGAWVVARALGSRGEVLGASPPTRVR